VPSSRGLWSFEARQGGLSRRSEKISPAILLNQFGISQQIQVIGEPSAVPIDIEPESPQAILLTLSRKGLGKTWGFRPSCPYLLTRRFSLLQAWDWRLLAFWV
jgi:hypothetical protein